MHGTFFLVIFQVFHDFQSLWEPCLCMRAVKALTSLFADMLGTMGWVGCGLLLLSGGTLTNN